MASGWFRHSYADLRPFVDCSSAPGSRVLQSGDRRHRTTVPADSCPAIAPAARGAQDCFAHSRAVLDARKTFLRLADRRLRAAASILSASAARSPAIAFRDYFRLHAHHSGCGESTRTIDRALAAKA